MREHLSTERVCLLYLLSRDPARNKKGQKTDRELANEYFSRHGNNDDLNSLEHLNYINEHNRENTGCLPNCEVSSKVQQWFWPNIREAAKELWEIYPRKLKVGDNEFNAKNLSLSKFSARYKAKGLTEQEDKDVLKVLKWAISTDNLKCGMIKFLELDAWEDLWHEMTSSNVVSHRSSNDLTIL